MKWRRFRTPLVAALTAVLLLGVVPSGLAQDSPDESTPMGVTLERLSNVLMVLEGELGALDAPRADRLEEAVGQMNEIVSDLLAASGDVDSEEDVELSPRKILGLDRRLHQLVNVLENLLGDPASTRPNVRSSLDDLRQWVDGYIQGLTAGMDPQAAKRFEAKAQEMVRDVAQKIAQLAARDVPEAPDQPRLERIVRQLRELTDQLDRLIWRRIPHPARES